MQKKKVSVKFTDPKGNNVNFHIEGSLDLPTLVSYLSNLDCFSGESKIPYDLEVDRINQPNVALEQGSSKLFINNHKQSLSSEIMLIMDSLDAGWFTSKDVQRVYEQRFNKYISLSKVSTYLSRFYDRGVLSRLKNGKSFRYKTELKETI